MIKSEEESEGDEEEYESMEEEGEGEEEESTKPKKVYLPGSSRGLKEGEEMVRDDSVYPLYHRFKTDLPCLSFDFVSEPSSSSNAPFSATLIAGTQAEKVRDNYLALLKLNNIQLKPENREGDEDEEESSDSEDEEEEGANGKKPRLCQTKILHHGGVNRIRNTRIGTTPVCAVWNDTGKVQLWNLNSAVEGVESGQNNTLKKEKPLYTFSGHQTEGYGLAWSSLTPGRLASGDNRKNIHLWEMGDGATWSVNQAPYAAHTGSVEDIQWSPTEDQIFMSCSADRSLRLWDARVNPSKANVLTVENAHSSDVNVISWNSGEPLLVSGGDDGVLKIWDLKTIQYKEEVASFNHHKKPITSVEWSPHDKTCIAASGEDDQLTIWDLAVEEDAQDSNKIDEKIDVPPQLLFVHLGQEEIKELHWVPNISGAIVSTALDGFNIFKTLSV